MAALHKSHIKISYLDLLNATTLDKNCGKNQEFTLPPTINVILVIQCSGPDDSNWGEGFFFRGRLCNGEKQYFCQDILSRVVGKFQRLSHYFVEYCQEMLSEFYISFRT